MIASCWRGCRRAVAYCARMLGVLTDTLDCKPHARWPLSEVTGPTMAPEAPPASDTGTDG